MPQAIAVIGEIIILEAGVSSAWYGLGAFLMHNAAGVFVAGSMLYGQAAKRKAQKAAAAAKDASLTSKEATGISTETPLRYTYGVDKVGANIVAMFTTGSTDQYRHMVAVVANHEVTAIDEIYINGKPLGTLDVNGYTQANQDSETKTYRGSSDGYKLPTNTQASSVVAQASSDGGLNWTTLTLTTHYTVSGTPLTVTMNSPYNTSTYLIKLTYAPNYFFEPGSSTHYTPNLTGGATTYQLPSDYSNLVVTQVDASAAFDDRNTNLVLTTDYTVNGSKMLTLNSSSYTSGGKYVQVAYTSALGASRVRVIKHLGTPTDTADSYLMSTVPGSWTSNHILRGHAYLVITLDLNLSEFQNGPPSIQVKLRGKKVYDPRLDSTVPGGTGSHRYTDSTTWAYSTNPALVALDYIMSPMVGISGVTLASVLPYYQTAANACDATITISGASVAKYTFNGSVTSDESGADVLTKMADSMAGIINGTDWSIYAGAYVTPTVTLNHIDDVVGQLAVSPGLGRGDIYNTVKGKFTGPENDFVATDYKPYIDSTYKSADGEELVKELEFPFTNQTQRIHNICSILMEDNRNGQTLTGEFSYKAWRLRPGDRVYFNSPPYTGVTSPTLLGMDAKVFRVTDKVFTFGKPIQLTLKADDSTIWDQAPAVSVLAVPNTNLPNPFDVPVITGLTAASGTAYLVKDTSGSIISRIYLTWTALAYNSGGIIQIQWKKASTTTWETTMVSVVDTSAYLSGVSDGEYYTIRARLYNPTISSFGNWAYVTHLVLGKTEAPRNYDNFSVETTADGTRRFTFSYTSAASIPLDLAGAEIRYITGNVASPTWASMAPATTGLPALHVGVLTTSPFETSKLPSGTFTFAVCAVDTTGNYSSTPLVSSGVVLNAPRLGEVIGSYDGVSDRWASGTVGGVNTGTAISANTGYTGSGKWSDYGTTWNARTVWGIDPYTTCTYQTPNIDLGKVVTTRADVNTAAKGDVSVKLYYSTDNVNWSSIVPYLGEAVSARYVYSVVTITANGSNPVPELSSLTLKCYTDIRTEIFQNVVVNTTSGFRGATNNLYVMIPTSITNVKGINVAIRDSSGTPWTWTWTPFSPITANNPTLYFTQNGVSAFPPSFDLTVMGY